MGVSTAKAWQEFPQVSGIPDAGLSATRHQGACPLDRLAICLSNSLAKGIAPSSVNNSAGYLLPNLRTCVVMHSYQTIVISVVPRLPTYGSDSYFHSKVPGVVLSW